MAAWIGAPRALSELFYDPPHGLERQAFAPLEQLSGHVNADGTGAAWWPEPGEPLLYRSERPPWADPNWRGLAPRLRAHAALGLVRSATPGQSLGAAAVGPFGGFGLAHAHNGFVEGWNARLAAELSAGLDEDIANSQGAGTDSELLFLHLVQSKRRDPDATLAEVLEIGLRRFAQQLEHRGRRARLDSILSDGASLAAVRFAVGLAPNTLYHSPREDGFWIASEPLDRAGNWRLLEPTELFHGTGGGSPPAHVEPKRTERAP